MNKLHLLPLLPLSLFLSDKAALAAEFSGPRIEARVGWDHPTIDVTVEGDEVLSENADGVTLGIEVGYDFNLGGAVVGAYGGAEFSTAEFCPEGFEDEDCLRARRNFTLGVRGGVAVAPSGLIYVKAGYSNGRLSVGGTEDADDEDSSRSRGGWHGGLGAEFALGSRTYFRTEYVYTRYDGLRDLDEDLRVRLRRHQIVVGFGLRI